MRNPNAPRRTYNNANLGKGLQTLIDYTNRQYKAKGVADVRLVPTPFQITRNGPRAGEMIGRKLPGEWVDYVGVGDGRAIAFDAKETKEKSLPLVNLKEHQYEFLESWWNQGACCFLIVAFTNKFEEIYLLPFETLKRYWEGMQNGERKSIPYSEFVENCELVKSNRGYTLDYLSVLRKKG